MRQHGEARGCAQLIADSDAASAAKTDPARPSALAELPSKQPPQKPTPAGSRRPSVAQCPRCAYPGLDARPAPVDEDNEELLKRLDAVAARERAVAQASAALAQRSAAEFAAEHQVPCERDAHMAAQGRPVAMCSGCMLCRAAGSLLRYVGSAARRTEGRGAEGVGGDRVGDFMERNE